MGDIKKGARVKEPQWNLISQKDCLMVDEGWRRFWAKRGGIPSLDVMDFTLSREIKELTAHQARLKKPVRAGKK